MALGPRPAGSPALARTRDYIRKELSALGLTVKEQAFEATTPAGKVRMVNVRAMIGGPDTARRLIVAGHYDTKLFKDVSFVGANDGGSSTGFLIELARVLKQSPPSMPVELLFLDGEEAVRLEWRDPDNRYGSRYYVESARKDGTLQQIAALVLVDMIGDKRSRHEAGVAIDAVADRRHLGYRRAARAQGVRRRGDADRGRSHSVSRGGSRRRSI